MKCCHLFRDGFIQRHTSRLRRFVHMVRRVVDGGDTSKLEGILRTTPKFFLASPPRRRRREETV